MPPDAGLAVPPLPLIPPDRRPLVHLSRRREFCLLPPQWDVRVESFLPPFGPKVSLRHGGSTYSTLRGLSGLGTWDFARYLVSAPTALSLARTFSIGAHGITGFDPSGSAFFAPAVSPSPEIDAVSIIEEDNVNDDDDDDASSLHRSDSAATKAVASSFASLLGLSAVEIPTRYGPSAARQTKRWSGSAPAVFRPPHRDTCLLAAFEQFNRNEKALMDSLSSAMTASGAASYAILTASTFIDGFISNMRGLFDFPQWPAFCDETSKAFKDYALSPLQDATTILASHFGRSLSGVRAGVIRQAENSISPILRASPPANSFYFGNPSAAVSSTMNLALMSSLVRRPPAFRGSAQRRPAYSARSTTTPAPAPSPSSSSSNRGKASARSSRGGRGGRRK